MTHRICHSIADKYTGVPTWHSQKEWIRNMTLRQLFRNKIFIGTLCILLALVVGFGVVPLYNAGTRQTVKVWRAKQTIYEYQQITADMVGQVEVGAYGLPKQAVKSEKNLIGKTAKAKIVQGDNILSGQLMSGNENSDEFLSEISREGKRAVSVTLPSLSASVSGKIIPGDVVSVLTFEKSTGAAAGGSSSSSSSSAGGFNNGISGNTASQSDKAAVQYPELQYIQVGALSDKSGRAVDGPGMSSTRDSTDVPATVTFICTPQQAIRLAEIEKKNDIILVFVARGTQAEKLIKLQDSNASSSSATSSQTNH